MEKAVITTSGLKKINCGKVYRYIYQARETNKQEIAESLSIGLTSLTQNLLWLEKEGLIVRDSDYDSTGGRPAKVIRIAAKARISIGIEILKDMIYFVAIDLYGAVMFSHSYAAGFDSSKDYCRALGKSLALFLKKYELESYTILGVSIALQGIVSADGSYIYYGKILNHTTLTLQDFQQFINYPCRIVHDSKAAAALETWRQERFRNSLILLLNDNFGGAVVIGGQIHQGGHAYGGTFEHLCLNPEGPECYCGKAGCLETYCSADCLKRKISTDLPSFFTAVRTQADDRAVQIWNEYLTYLGLAIHNLTMVLDVPVILSGLLSAYFTDEDIDFLYQRIEVLSPFKMGRDFLYLSGYGSMSPAVGAALYDIDLFLDSM